MSNNAPHSPDPQPPSGSSLSITELVLRHHAELFGYAFRLSGNRDEAEDLVQQVFLAAHARLHQLQKAEAARGWLYAILRNAFLKDRRKQNLAPPVDGEVDLDSLTDNRLEDSLRLAEIGPGGVDREQLQAALNELPDEFRVVVLMFYFEDCSYRDIAEQLGIPSGTVMSRLSRAKQHLRLRLFSTDDSAVGSAKGAIPTHGSGQRHANERHLSERRANGQGGAE